MTAYEWEATKQLLHRRWQEDKEKDRQKEKKAQAADRNVRRRRR